MDNNELAIIANQMRSKVIHNAFLNQTPHVGSCFSCIDILVALYWNVLRIDPLNPTDPSRDRFILSKGHAAPALYQVLARKQFFPEHWLESYGQNGSLFGEHPPAHGIPGIEAATGSLGHGLSIGVGFALASRIQKIDDRVYVLLGDGECNEGSVWEAAMFAPAQKLNNLMAIIDFNKWQATGSSEETMSLNPLIDKWQAFGWEAVEIDGHDFHMLSNYLSDLPVVSNKPVALIAHTIKGKGVSFILDFGQKYPNSPSI